MNRFYPLITLFIIAFGFLLSCNQEQEKNASKERPNIILILADDLGYGDLSSYGSEIPTPHIDQIGKEGIKFTDFYVTSPSCTPSRYSLLTGSYPKRSMHGLDKVIMPNHTGRRFDSSEKLISEYLKAEGYSTAIFGKWHLGSDNVQDFPQNHGFDEFVGLTTGCIDYFRHSYSSLEKSWYQQDTLFEEEGYATDLITDHTLAFIDQEKDTDNPFFLYLSFNAPHYGKSIPQDSSKQHTIVLKEGKYSGIPIINALQAPEHYLQQFSHINDIYRRYYAAMVVSMDDNVGRLIKQLKADDLYDNTLIWFISDNGAYAQKYFGHGSNGSLKGQKGQVYEGGIRVPSLLCWKKEINPNQVLDQPGCTFDILPTLANILGFSEELATNERIDGMDISNSIFHGKKMDRSIAWGSDSGPQSAFRKGNWKMVKGKELYNLELDKEETQNQAAQHPDILKELNHLFEQQMQKINESD